jgi:hypothetical protein
MESGDQRMQTATGAASVVHTSAAMCAVICASGSTAASPLAVAGTARPDLE